MLTQEQQNALLQGAAKSANLAHLVNLPNEKTAIFLEGIKFGIRACSIHVSMTGEKDEEPPDGD